MFDADHVRREMEERSDADLVGILEERESGEWQPEVYRIVEAILWSRGVEVELAVAAARASRESAEAADDVDLVVVATYLAPADAHLCRIRLEQAGIEAFISDENVSTVHFGFAVAVGGIKVSVRRTDAEAAAAVLQMEPAPVATECPRCGSSDVTHRVRTDRVSTVSVAFLLGIPVAQHEHVSLCVTCGAEW